MRQRSEATRPPSARIEDFILAVLGLVAGPLLWWMSQTWQQNPAATSVQTMEYWIALLCGFLGLALSFLWCFFLMSGLVFAVALKTKNKVISYWSGLLTPKFLQRIIVAVVGLQLTFGAQAVAAEETSPEPAEVSSTATPENPFMPELADMTTTTDETDSHDATTPSPDGSSTDPTSVAPPPDATSEVSTTPEQQQSHQIELDPTPQPSVATEIAQSAPEPEPRQTTTIPAPQEPARNMVDDQSSSPGIPEAFLPQKPLPSPYIAAPNPDRTIEDPTLVIQAGDNLWDIAHQELGADAPLAQIDQRWRQWWQHNLDNIGDDPHKLTPGTVLHAPPFTH